MPNLLPEDAPFSPSQRAWLNGFLSASLGLPANGSAAPPPPPASANGASANGVALSGASANGASANGVATLAAPAHAEPKAQAEPKAHAEVKAEAKEARKAIVYSRDDPFPARVLHVEPLTGPDSAKDVRAVALDLAGSGLRYQAGDALGLYPENCAELVEEVLEALGATGEEPVVTPESRIVPMRVALALAYDITRVGENLLGVLAAGAGDEDEAKALQELADEDARDWLKGRDVLDVLRWFRSCQAAPEEIVASLQPLQPRLYSIASSQKAFPNEVHLTVGVVRYQAAERDRKGVASTFLADFNALRPGRKVSIFVHPSPGFRLPEDGNTPVIMVGPGTGIAPFRAFLQERRALGAGGKNWLFFGDQRRHCDFLYRHQLDEHLSDGSLVRLDTAFSRDQAAKIYVQTRMLEHAAQIWSWLEEDAHFYVCGDAKRMARDVDEALHHIVMEQGQMPQSDAKAYVQSLVKARRYQRDVY